MIKIKLIQKLIKNIQDKLSKESLQRILVSFVITGTILSGVSAFQNNPGLFDKIANIGADISAKAANCPGGYTFNSTLNLCEQFVAYSVGTTCPSGFTNTSNGTSTQCRITTASFAALDVTINQSSSQTDPVAPGIIKYTAIFDSPIITSSFTTNDITIGGTSTGAVIMSIAEISPNNGTAFEILVNATNGGTVDVDISSALIQYSSSVLGTTESSPVTIAIDSSSNVYTSNYFSNNVSKITPTGVSSILGSTGSNPSGIAVDSSGNVYTANRFSNNVSKITPTGVSTILGTTGSQPNGIAVDSFGNVYTTNQNSNNVSKITPAGVSTILGTTGNYPIGIAVDSFGNVYTTNSDSNNVSKINPAGFSSIYGTTGLFPGSIALDSSGNVYTSNLNSNNVSKITPTGVSTILGTIGTPNGIALDSSGNIYVSNQNSNNVSKINPAGVVTIIGTSDLSPFDIALDSAGNVYVPNYNSNNVTKLTQTFTGIKSISGLYNRFSTSIDSTVTIIVSCTNGATNPPGCNSCPAGNYYNTTTSTCTICPAGSACTGLTAQPVPCPAGTSATAGQTSCTTCPVNTYCAGTGNTTPTPCPTNTSSTSGSTLLTSCTSTCAAGTYLSISFTCTICPVNTYCAGIGNTTPTPCPTGQNSSAGSISISACSYPFGYILITNQSSSSTNSSAITSSSSANPNLDTDGDGTIDSIEKSAPNNGDGNGDGVADYLQSNVITVKVKDSSNDYVTVEISSTEDEGGCSISKLTQNIDELQVSSTDENYSYPFGLMEMKIECKDITLKLINKSNINIYWHSITDWSNYEYRKFGNKIPGDDSTTKWFSFLDRTNSVTNIPLDLNFKQIGSRKTGVASFALIDGQLGDNTVKDGFIVDPSGPALKSTPEQKISENIISLARTGGLVASNNSTFILLAMIGLFLSLGWVTRRRLAQDEGRSISSTVASNQGVNTNWFTTIMHIIISKYNKNVQTKDPFSKSFDKLKEKISLESQCLFDNTKLAISNDYNSTKIVPNNIILETNPVEVKTTIIAQEAVLSEPQFRTINLDSTLNHKEEEELLLSKIKLDSKAWSNWLKLADHYRTHDMLLEAQETYSYVFHKANSLNKEIAKMRLMDMMK